RDIELARDGRCLSSLGTHRARHHPGSRCPALVAAAVLQGSVVLHTGPPARSHPPTVWVFRAGAGGRLTRQRRGTGKWHLSAIGTLTRGRRDTHPPASPPGPQTRTTTAARHPAAPDVYSRLLRPDAL